MSESETEDQLSWEEQEQLEWEIQHIRDDKGYCKTCKAYGQNCIGLSGYSPKQLSAVHLSIEELGVISSRMTAVGVVSRDIKSLLKATKLEYHRMVNENLCTCDKEYGEADPECVACLDQYRNERYGPDIHNVNCVCNECRGFGNY